MSEWSVISNGSDGETTPASDNGFEVISHPSLKHTTVKAPEMPRPANSQAAVSQWLEDQRANDPVSKGVSTENAIPVLPSPKSSTLLRIDLPVHKLPKYRPNTTPGLISILDHPSTWFATLMEPTNKNSPLTRLLQSLEHTRATYQTSGLMYLAFWGSFYEEEADSKEKWLYLVIAKRVHESLKRDHKEYIVMAHGDFLPGVNDVAGGKTEMKRKLAIKNHRTYFMIGSETPFKWLPWEDGEAQYNATNF
ncbi:hypothetical protein EG329_000982 [Mollisiaceae sp. DMI_Dod_QoI]|nr:hypothetical protein EG329_000982 [Helotiales sp. DMI_Dod_QoI]